MGFPGSSADKDSACNAGDPSLSPGSGSSPGEGIGYTLQYFGGFPGGSHGKEFPCNVEDLGSIPSLGRSPGGEHGNPLQYFCLGNPMDRGAWRAAIHGVAKSWTQFSDWARAHRNTHTYVIRCMYYTISPPYLWTLNLQIQRASYYTIYTIHKGQLYITICVWKMQEFGLVLCRFSHVWTVAKPNGL